MFVGFNQSIAWQQGRVEITQNNPLDRNVIIILMVLGLVVLMRRLSQFQIKLSNNSWLFAFFILCLISVIWSGYPDLALKRWMRLAGDIIVVLLILTEREPKEGVFRIMRRVAILLLPLSVLLVKFYGQMGRIYTPFGGQMWVGVADHKNSLGELCAFMGIVLVWRNLKKWPKVDP
jgi:hypothetical protein